MLGRIRLFLFMKVPLLQLINRCQGKRCIVAALGPSLRSQLDFIREIHVPSFTLISCNEMDTMANLVPDYWVHANSEDTIRALFPRMNALKETHVVYADSVDPTPAHDVERLLEVNYTPYDQRYFAQGKTIQQVLQAYTGHTVHYGAGHTVALHMLSLAILLGHKEIYLTGMDLDYTKGYVHPDRQCVHSFDHDKPEIIDDCKVIQDSAARVGAEIFALPGQPLHDFMRERLP